MKVSEGKEESSGKELYWNAPIKSWGGRIRTECWAEIGLHNQRPRDWEWKWGVSV